MASAAHTSGNLMEPAASPTTARSWTDLGFGSAAIIFAAVAIPNVVLVAVFSGLGAGLEVFNAVAHYSAEGDVCFVFALLLVAALYVCDWPHWQGCNQVLGLVPPWILGSVGTVLKGCKYPWGPMLMCMVLLVLFLGALRVGPGKNSKRMQFYKVASISTGCCGVVISLLWLGWVLTGTNWNLELQEEWAAESTPMYEVLYSKRALVYQDDCGPNRNLSAITSEERKDVKLACGKAHTALFMVWACPLIGACVNLVIASFVFLHGVAPHTDRPKSEQLDTKKLEVDLKRFVLVLTVLLMGMYGSSSISGTSVRLGGTLMSFFGAGLVALVAWTYLEVGPQVISEHIHGSKFALMVVAASSSDWAKAMFVGVPGLLIPVLYCLEKARRLFVRRFQRGGSDEVEKIWNMVVQKLKEFYWVGVLLKICLLGEVFFMFQVGVAKATYVFLSWMNSALADYNFGLVIFIILVIGYAMFLLPPVPGVPVYVFCGVVIADQGRRIDSIGFGGGCVIAVFVAWVLKLVACCGQYAIGCYLGRYVKVQQLIGVDKVLTRAIQMILERRGLDVGKVTVLVGGPDWPVSVTCGILRLDIFQMLLGTAPVILILAPCVLAGAFMSRVTGGEDSIWNVLSTFFLTASVVVQMGSMFMVVYTTTLVIDQHSEELARPRPEHMVVEELTKKEEAYNTAYFEATQWDKLNSIRQAGILLAAGFIIVSGYTFAFGDEYCFENFSVSSKISDPLDENGLDNNMLNIVIAPLGWITLTIFALACVLHLVVLRDMQGLAMRHLAAQPPKDAPPSTSVKVAPRDVTPTEELSEEIEASAGAEEPPKQPADTSVPPQTHGVPKLSAVSSL